MKYQKRYDCRYRSGIPRKSWSRYNTPCQLKHIYQLNKLYYEMDIPVVEEVMHVFIHLLLKYIDFNMNISNGFAKVTATTPLVEIVHLYQCNKTPLKYANTNSKYGHFLWNTRLWQPGIFFKIWKGQRLGWRNPSPLVSWKYSK